MLLKEYRICMPLSVEEYRIGQLYMIAKHSNEQSAKGEGVEVVKNEPVNHEQHGSGQYTEKRIHLSSRLPTWIQGMIPHVFYITEKAWNFYPYTITEYTCSFIPRFHIHIETRYEDNNGSSENCLTLTEEDLEQREVLSLDIAYDDIPPKHYKEEEDCKTFRSEKTGRGPLPPGWRDFQKPIMCSYKAVKVKFEVWGLQTKVEEFTHRAIRDILLVGHRQAFAWIDEWFGMTIGDIRDYENQMHTETNKKVLRQNSNISSSGSPERPPPDEAAFEAQ
ncbi:cytoplasmic phosphatidylinositol transfer protein 1-like [Tubulanus polymorphus]|uniref:cytoplasmic phosphatidylinositol transfer protein 1-like n=1 Tax=Tubulanus polymorphus TaxID=672921 RepID=UPI003DA3F9D4